MRLNGNRGVGGGVDMCIHLAWVDLIALLMSLQLYKFLTRRTESKFNKKVLKLLILSRMHRPPITLLRIASILERRKKKELVGCFGFDDCMLIQEVYFDYGEIQNVFFLNCKLCLERDMLAGWKGSNYCCTFDGDKRSLPFQCSKNENMCGEVHYHSSSKNSQGK